MLLLSVNIIRIRDEGLPEFSAVEHREISPLTGRDHQMRCIA
jgi:23S rRNA-/tRNA-specific pseudouridylate synthase